MALTTGRVFKECVTGLGRPRTLSERLWKVLDDLSMNTTVKLISYSLSVVFFIFLILLPLILGILLKANLFWEIFAYPELMNRAKSAILWSFIIAFTVSTLDLIAGLPLAWFIVRSGSRWTKIVDSMADIPFIIPTAALGYSFLLFWSREEGISSLFGFDSLIPPGALLVMLLHFAFSFPVIVRVMVGELMNYREVYEVAAGTLGAQPFTIARTVTLPMLKPALVASFLLAFARSLSETGATVMVAGAFENGPVFIKNAKDAGLESPMVFVSSILIFLSIAIFFSIDIMGPRMRLPFRKVWPNFEKKLSSATAVKARNSLTFVVFLGLVILPSLFIALPAVQAVIDGTLIRAVRGVGPWSRFWESITLSYAIGTIVTVVNVILGLPVAILVARNKLGRVTSVLNMMVNIPIVIPSVALGVSLRIFWRDTFALPEFWALVLAHTAITYTYFVRSMSAAIEGISQEMEEVASTLGSSPIAIFRKITFPLTKYSLFSGAILVFTRSVDETGATIAVSEKLRTAPVLLVDWVKGTIPTSRSDIALGIGFLVVLSFAVLLALRLLIEGRK